MSEILKRNTIDCCLIQIIENEVVCLNKNNIVTYKYHVEVYLTSGSKNPYRTKLTIHKDNEDGEIIFEGMLDKVYHTNSLFEAQVLQNKLIKKHE